MGTITSGTGLISGIDYTSLIEQLIEIEAAPRDDLLDRIDEIDEQRSAYEEISAQISALLSGVEQLDTRSFFLSNIVSSSDTDVLSASADSDASVGSYSFIVRSLASTHQVVSRGYSGLDTQLDADEIYIESAQARVDAETTLDELNGYSGVQRGSFEIVDGDGNSATININDAVTLNDVVERINEAELNVEAEISGDRLVLTETNGGSLRVREVNGGSTAEDLGFGLGYTYDAGGLLEGSTLVYLSDSTPLSALNDSTGVRHLESGADFSINGIEVELSEIIKTDTRLERLNRGQGVELGTISITTEDEDGVQHTQEVDLTGLSTVGEIEDAIEGGVEGVSVTLADGHLVVAYSDGSTDRYIEIEDVSGNSASDLGIEDSSAYGKITGDEVLNVDTLGAVVAAINYATDNDGSVTASLDGTRLVIDGGSSTELTALNGSQALFDLGFTEGTQEGTVSGGRVIGGVNSALLSSLNGGNGFEPGQIRIDVGSSSVTLDLSGTETVQEVIDRINEASEAEELGIEASCDYTGTKLVIESIDGVSEISISDVGDGTFAADTGLAQEASAKVTSDNLQLCYINENTSLDDLNGGSGVTLGTIKLTNSVGLSASVDLTDCTTLQDVIDEINDATISSGESLGITARINDTGDGLLLEDNAGGTLGIEVEDASGSAASDLNLLGESVDGTIDGSYEISIELSGNETLEDVVELINEQGGIATASILNDGTGISPYRLQITSNTCGKDGELVVDGLSFSTLSDAQDARIILGSDADSGIMITSSSNTLTDVAPGLTIDLTSVSDDPVTVSVSHDSEGVTEAIQSFVDNFNAAIDLINEYGDYDSETETAGILLGENTLQMVERRLWSMVTARQDNATGDIQRLSDLGLSISDGQIELDEDELADAIANNLEEVIDFFTNEDTGMAFVMEEQLEGITETDGLIDRRDSTLESQEERMNDRVDVLNDRLDRKYDQLLEEYTALETILADYQSQLTVLEELESLI